MAALEGPSRRYLVTGGCGFIGSHCCLELLKAGHSVTVLDDLSNSSPESLVRVRELFGIDAADDRLVFVECDLCDKAALDAAVAAWSTCAACIHFAGLKSVGESVRDPLAYYTCNVGGTLALLDALRKHGIRRIVFSSSATVYGTAPVPITEQSPVGAGITNAYGRTKYVIEEILRDFAASPEGQGWSIMILRYFNPVGAHPSGRIGEDPNGPPNNLMPYVAQVAIGRRPKLTVFGADYDTPDGTGVRDYIHVMDLVDGHLAALGYLDANGAGAYTFNLGTGKGFSVLEMVKAMEEASGRPIAYEVGPRRAGDLASVYADTATAERDLGFKCSRSLVDMCADLWRWQVANPEGFATGGGK